ncbi:MAG: hypothetical protein Q6361_04080 [Candidatus Hermodarchaeota archaeon]|nr:hypothetical protein [Candidatus Hermodarchaeota archaeon]
MSSFYARLKLNSILLPILVAIGMIAYFVVLNLILALVSIPLPQSSAVRYFVIPVIFAFPWILFVFIFRERTINASEIMNAKGNLIPLRWRMLYGFNTLIILGFFIFPFISPPLAIFAALVLAYRLVHRSDSIWNKSSGQRMGYTLLLFLLLAAFPVYFTVIWYQYFLTSVVAVIFASWINYFDLMYFTSLCIANALSIGALLALSYGTLDERGKLRYEDAKKMWLIYFGQLVLIVLQWVFLNPWFSIGINFANPDPFGLAGSLGNITYLNYICLGIFGIVYLVKLIVGLGSGMKLSVIGIFFAAAFLIVEVLSSFLIPSGTFLRPVLIVGSSLLFVFAFAVSFFAAPDELVDFEALQVEETDPLEKQALEEAEAAALDDEES